MPRIPPVYLDCVCYLYDTEEHARAGEEFGGTGFLMTLPSERFPKQIEYIYAVTNWHVACRGHSVLRLNTRDGGVDVFPFGPEEWHFLPDYDIAVILVPANKAVHKFSTVPAEGFLTKALLDARKMGPGEDVFMVGRFVDHDGGLTNLPAVRFGNISVMPSPIEQPNERMTDAYCIDLHSRSGYSGSPVFVYRTPGYDLEDIYDGSKPRVLFGGSQLLLLLGIHFSQFPELWEVVSGAATASKRESQEPLITEGRYVKGLSGMTCVLPAWAILEVLNMPYLKETRRTADAVWEAKFKKEGFPPEPEVSSAPEVGKP